MITSEYINKIICGNSIEVMKEMAEESVDMIFADPPYFMQTEGELLRADGSKFNGVTDNWDKFSGYNEYDNFCFDWLKECKRILKKDGSIWVIGSFQNIYRIGYIMQNMGFWILNDVIWSKLNAAPNFAGTRFQNSHETLLWCTKDKKSKYTFNYKTMKYLNNDKQQKSVWDIGLCIGNERLKDSNGTKIHSTQKPSKLLYNVIISSTKPGDIVFDPFFGTGTTGAVAKLTGRNFIGIEMDKEYIKSAQDRIDKIVPKLDDVTNMEYEVKPPKVPMETLIKSNLLKEGQKLYNKDKTKVVEILNNGHVTDNEDILSIHKMSAKQLGKDNNNGWNYFWVESDNNFVELDSLRYKYKEQIKV
ncbi:MAG: site-specific DNA-methyltransferase [Clostridia bacterium]